jgi:hypothetical protein
MSRPRPSSEPAKPQMIRCGNSDDGCGRECKIIKFNKEAQMIEAENWNPAAHLCLPCCNKLAYDWGISFEDVDFLMVAKHNARAGKMGKPGTKEEVLAILDRAGIKRKARPSWTQAPANAAIPTGDR